MRTYTEEISKVKKTLLNTQMPLRLLQMTKL